MEEVVGSAGVVEFPVFEGEVPIDVEVCLVSLLLSKAARSCLNSASAACSSRVGDLCGASCDGACCWGTDDSESSF